MTRGKRVFALGFFDGVHRGHQALLEQCVRLASELDAQTAAITFERHPKSLFCSEAPKLISSAADRQQLLRHYGISAIFTYPVVEEVMGMPWQNFLGELMDCGAVGFVCGDDFRFGHRGEGNGEKLRQFCRERNMPCVIVPEQTLGGIRISSSYIRKQLETGDMETAVHFLGHGYYLTGEVVSGRRLGRKMGFPTANVLLPEGIVCPRHGVYACYAHVDGVKYPAVTNVGSRPTVDGHQVRTESWILDFDGDLYGKTITLEFRWFLREEQKFASLEELKTQVERDAVCTREYFEKNG